MSGFRVAPAAVLTAMSGFRVASAKPLDTVRRRASSDRPGRRPRGRPREAKPTGDALEAGPARTHTLRAAGQPFDIAGRQKIVAGVN